MRRPSVLSFAAAALLCVLSLPALVSAHVRLLYTNVPIRNAASATANGAYSVAGPCGGVLSYGIRGVTEWTSEQNVELTIGLQRRTPGRQERLPRHLLLRAGRTGRQREHRRGSAQGTAQRERAPAAQRKPDGPRDGIAHQRLQAGVQAARRRRRFQLRLLRHGPEKLVGQTPDPTTPFAIADWHDSQGSRGRKSDDKEYELTSIFSAAASSPAQGRLRGREAAAQSRALADPDADADSFAGRHLQDALRGLLQRNRRYRQRE